MIRHIAASFPRFLAYLIVVAVALDGYLVIHIRAHAIGGTPVILTTDVGAIYASPERVASARSIFALYGATGHQDSIQMRNITTPIIAAAKDTGARVIALRDWVRRQVHGTGVNALASEWRTPIQLLRAAQADTDLSCAPLAVLFQGVLQANGIPSRRVALLRSPPLDQWATHVTVEAFVGGHWLLTDPMFNASWIVNGKPASAWDVHEYLMHANQRGQTLIAQTGAFQPTPSLETYYTNPLSLFVNVVYLSPTEASHQALWRYTPLRVFRQDIVALVDTPDEETVSPFVPHNRLVWLTFVWLPLAIVIALLGGIIAALSDRLVPPNN